MVQSINATSNSRFFNSAYVPRKVDKPYFKFSLNFMTGLVPDNMKSYNPVLPGEALDMKKLGNYMSYENGVLKIKDTVGLAYYALKTIMYDGVKSGSLNVPKTSATILGKQHTSFVLPHDSLRALIKRNVAYPLLPAAFRDSLDKIINQFPEYFTLPEGANMSSLYAAIPQFEIGSLWGTEALIRFVPPVDMGKNIGKFAFWGLGLKHSISQYFTEQIDENTEYTPFDLAVQAVYQGTYLTNEVGVTKAELTARANIWDFNIEFGKRFKNLFDVYSGFSYEMLNISSDYIFYIPVEQQAQLGLLRIGPKLDANGNPVRDVNGNIITEIKKPEQPNYPGDQHPQKSKVKISDSNFKWIIGMSKDIGNFTIFADYNVSKFNIFTAGVSYKF
jgi:hypothetical protein